MLFYHKENSSTKSCKIYESKSTINLAISYVLLYINAISARCPSFWLTICFYFDWRIVQHGRNGKCGPIAPEHVSAEYVGEREDAREAWEDAKESQLWMNRATHKYLRVYIIWVIVLFFVFYKFDFVSRFVESNVKRELFFCMLEKNCLV